MSQVSRHFIPKKGCPHCSNCDSIFLQLQAIQIKLVLGHSAQWRKKPTQEGYTHDWTILVRGEDGQEIRHFVEKVIFFLHESFAKPKRGKLIASL